jgi:tRNA pseudouridine38-40 synthase
MASIKLVVAYDGTDFRGWADQPGVRTVEGALSEVLERVLHQPPENLSCAGRTDAGVHAWGQVVSFDADDDLDPSRLQSAVNGVLAPEVVVREAEVVEPGFDARRSARWRAYRYAVVNRPVPDPFLARYAWWVPTPLDVSALRLGADPFVGEHDFAAFCRQGPEGSTTVRRILESRWHDLGKGVLRYDVRATAFCWQMVRSIVGTLVDVGTGKRRPGELMGILRSKERAHAGQPAPPQGLCLWEVGYT